ncbi:Ig-like domain-containing protein [Hymenobacter siberiensis]|uniref:Ig-like domain-containing protein n=1 Tax=Hymenobacter siberiensis TaxID=2848396 RepID=UPI001C1DE457|nr:Ig-like domain-containing protein [Hymenobacter siberiensis]
MKKDNYSILDLPICRLLLLLWLALLSTLGGTASALARPADVLVDYCFTTPDYAVLAETVGPNVNFTFHPLGATAGGNLAIIYLREGSAGAYPGYTMTKNAAGDFTFSKAVAGGVVTSLYFTYEVGPGGPQRNTAATPHSYTVGTVCAVSSSNVPPTVSLTAPAASAVFAAPATITLTANATDSDGTIAKVEFYQGTTLLGQALTAPYTYTWTGVPGDAYSLTAKATDNGNASTTSAPVAILVQSPDGYCSTRPDYSYSAVTTGGNVTFTFHPRGATAGGNLAIVFIREGSIGAYPGYTMVKNAAGDFTFSKAIASGTVTSVYFTYEIGPGGAQQTSLTDPHIYTVGTSCRTATATATQPASLTTALSISPNPASGRAVLTFAPGPASAFVATLYDLRGARVKTIGVGTAEAGKALALPLSTEDLADGIYLVKLQTSYGVATARLVVSR